ncbi:MAG: DUF3552 domain-containing protein, partial [Prevotellaceae bacterium]|nr:DUF3552 domain-containing protein [Prevotellaceae bacterium]
MNLFLLIVALVCIAIGVGGGYLLFRYVLTGMLRRQLDEAEKEAQVIKEKKLLEVKEKFLNKKAELEKEVQQRSQRILQSENKLKQREMVINQRHEDVNRRKQELDSQQGRLKNQEQLLARKEEELGKMHEREIAKLEELSGISAEEARNHLVESLKAEAQTRAQSYVNEIMDEAKINANKEAKRIVIQTIQRVATETAIENSVTVFHIENDDVKGRIIGREGRNIRAFEAATGVE